MHQKALKDQKDPRVTLATTDHQGLPDKTDYPETPEEKARRVIKEMKERRDHQDLRDLPEAPLEHRSSCMDLQDPVEIPERKDQEDPRDTSERRESQGNPVLEEHVAKLVIRDHKVLLVKMEPMGRKENQEASAQWELLDFPDDQDLKANAERKERREMSVMPARRVRKETLEGTVKMANLVFLE